MIDYDDNKYSDNHISEFLLFYIVASHENQILNKRNQLLASKLKRMCLARYGAIAGNAIFGQPDRTKAIEAILNAAKA